VDVTLWKWSDIFEIFDQVAQSEKVNAWQAGDLLLIGYLLYVINSSHTFRLTFFKPCTVAITGAKPV
jgi:hypothetical protein